MSQLLPQDMLLAIKLLSDQPKWTFESMGEEIGISASQCHNSYKRIVRSGLVDEASRLPRKSNILELMIHGIKYIFPAEPQNIVKGLPTAHSAKIMKEKIVGAENVKYVWEHPKGKTKGLKIEPLYKTIPEVSLTDNKTYEIFAVLDSIRLGKARERKEAEKLLEDLIYAR